MSYYVSGKEVTSSRVQSMCLLLFLPKNNGDNIFLCISQVINFKSNKLYENNIVNQRKKKNYTVFVQIKSITLYARIIVFDVSNRFLGPVLGQNSWQLSRIETKLIKVAHTLRPFYLVVTLIVFTPKFTYFRRQINWRKYVIKGE